MNMTKLTKPTLKMNNRWMSALILTVGLVMIGLGVYFGLIQAHGYEKTAATVIRLREEDSVDSDGSHSTVYYPTVTYSVDGKEYTVSLNDGVSPKKLNQQVSVKYDPEDPEQAVLDSPGLVVYLIAVGALLVGLEIYAALKNRKRREQLEEDRTGPLFGASIRSGAERKLYFLTDLGTAKGGCHIEDEHRTVLYEAVATRFSLIADSVYDFVDHTLNRRQPHLVSKTVTSSSDAIWVLDNHSTFDLDGKDVWKQLHENGVRIETRLQGLHWAYTIFRDGAEIARAETSGRLVHEEDAEDQDVLAKAPSRGFFRVRTNEQNLDVIFLTLFAIGRTDMAAYN